MIKSFLKKIIVFILTYLARIVILKYKPKIIAVAGSVGKTSTKDAIYTVLNSKLSVWKSDKSFNSEIGVPLAILGLKNGWSNPFLWLGNFWKGFELAILNEPYPKYLVLEIGADRPCDIRRIVAWLKPDVSVITRFGEVPVHVEFFKDRLELIEEDAEIVKALKKDGLLILNQDDKDALILKEKSTAKHLTYGFDPSSSIIASNTQIVYEGGKPSGITSKVDFEGTSAPLRISGVVGKAQIYASLPALLVGQHYGINIVSGVASLQNHETPPGRLKIIQGLKNTTIIDDSYNSSPVAVEEAFKSISEINSLNRKI